MKRIILLQALLFSIQLLSSSQLLAQEDERPMVISAGVGVSGGMGVIAMRTAEGGLFFPAVYNDVVFKKSSTPVVAASIEKGFSKYFSAGAAASYQSYDVAYKFSNGSVLDNNDRYQRINIGIRGLAHLSERRDLDSYLGMRVGYTIWSFTTANPDPSYTERKGLGSRPSMQVLYGLKYFIGNYGMGFEVGLGTAPYLGLANVCYRFGEQE